MKLILSIFLAAILLVSAVVVHDSFAASKSQKAIDKAIKKAAPFADVCKVAITTGPNQTLQLVFDKDSERCKGVLPTPEPEPTPTPTPVPSGVPALNTTKTIRLGVFADVDNNGGLDTQLNLFKKYGVQYCIVAGDYAYHSGSSVLDNMLADGCVPTNTEIAVGNHDQCGPIKQWLGDSSCYGVRLFANAKLAIHTIDANADFGCSGTQFNTIKSGLESSNAQYDIALVHQPFATVKSNHGPNGAFSCYQSLFKANGVSAVLQGHNHNYQRFSIDNILYLVAGTGTHDSGSSMYPVGSDNFNGNKCLKCSTGTNGITILDLDLTKKQINGYFVSNADKIVDSFVVN
jgi:predicted phosphodiesterase